MTASGRTGVLLAALAIGLFAPSVKAGQETSQGARQSEEPKETTLIGRVVDDQGFPIEMALVGLTRSNQGVMSDEAGRFALKVGPQYTYRVSAEQIGYESAEVVVEAADIDRPVTIRLLRDPLALAGLEVTVERFERRRRFFPGTIRVVDQEMLARTAATNARDVIRQHAPLMRPCLHDAYQDCVLRRGSVAPMAICIDERRAFGARDELELYSPEELYMVEVYDRGRAVRVYTRWFVERMVEKPRNLVPIEFGC